LKTILIFASLLLSSAAMGQLPGEASYSVASHPWPESFGNHRAVIEVGEPAEIVVLDILWRRHDPEPWKRRFIIVEASGGDTIPNIFRYEVNNERCRLAFGPVKRAGTYYFYYLPYVVQDGWGFFGNDYFPVEEKPSEMWMKHNQPDKASAVSRFAKATLRVIESRTAFDSFFPMEIIPLSSEKSEMMEKYRSSWLIFPEDRAFPVRMRDELPLRWVIAGPSDEFSGDACRNEYYTFQLGVYASESSLENLKVEFSDLAGDKGKISASSLTCFNTGGTDPYGQPFVKKVNVKMGSVQPLWIGIDIPAGIRPGNYRGRIRVIPGNADPRTINVMLRINDTVLTDRGDNEPWRHSRLRWLNSTLGIDDEPVKPYEAIETIGDNSYRLTEKILRLGKYGLPGSVRVNGVEILANPVSLVVESEDGPENFSGPGKISTRVNSPGVVSREWRSRTGNLELNGTGIIESDGYINFRLTLTAMKDMGIKDVRLEIPFVTDIAQYMIGMGLPGTLVPEKHEAVWSGPHDSFWIGNTRGGIWVELRGSSYSGPLLNLYHPAPPESWYNADKGGFRIDKGNGSTDAIVFSGERRLFKGQKLDFEWSMLITPVKEINYVSQFTDRYYHNGEHPMPSDADIASGVRIVNLHHANNYNPHINYPFIAVDSMKWFVGKLHEKGLKVKIYYTIRELTNYTTELWALRSLGDEILGDGDGGGYTWLREHLITGYRPQWYQHFPDKSPDASIVNAPGSSRWYNYYIEGLAWLVRNVEIDGLYLDDVTYDRRTLKRIRKVLDNSRPGCLLDLHSNTGFSKGPANQYAEFFPYIDKLWFGESFMYDQMPPENWLVESSGIPFGLMGDMLQGGGNRWLGMVYGMTVRHPWLTEGIRCDPRPVWKIWDQFGIASSVMKGYWQNDCPVHAGHPEVHATVYQKKDSSLVSAGNWSEEPVEFSFSYDWAALGMDPDKAVLEAPYIKDFQEAATYRPYDTIQVLPKKGWIFYLYEKIR
jgi:hypothetical protein